MLAITQRTMHFVSKERIGECVLLYIGDILVYGKEKKEHDDKVKYVRKMLERYGLAENTDKRVSCTERVRFLIMS